MVVKIYGPLGSKAAVYLLDRIEGDRNSNGDDYRLIDTERAHVEADEVLLAAVPPEVKAAYNRLVNRIGELYYA